MSEILTITRAIGREFIINEIRGTKAEEGGNSRPICFHNSDTLADYVKAWCLCEDKPLLTKGDN